MSREEAKSGAEGESSEPDHELGARLEAFRPRLRRMIAWRMDPRLSRRLDGSDVLQEAFVEVMRRKGEQRPADMSLYVWVRLITEQKVKELQRRHLGAKMRDVRREVAGRTPPDASSVHLARVIAAQGESPSQVASRHELEERLRDTLERMKPGHREILLLRHFEQLTNTECAEVLGLTPKAASTRHLRATRRLRWFMRAYEDLPGDPFGSDGRTDGDGTL